MGIVREGVPGAVISIQTFGDLVNFHTHLHCLVTDGCFHVLPEIDVKKLENLFRHKVFKMLLREKKISRELIGKLLSWRNSGFNIHNQVKIQSHDRHGWESLAQYIFRSPFSQEKMTYQKDSRIVLYRSKMNLTSRETLPCSLSWTGWRRSPPTSPIKGSNWSAAMVSTVTSQGEKRRNLRE